VKGSKTRRNRSLYVDADTIAMLRRYCQERDEVAELAQIPLAADPFLFSLTPDSARPMSPHYVTRQVAILKEHLGIEDKRPETIACENEALQRFRQPPGNRPAGRRGAPANGGMTYREIAERLGRSERWVALAIAAARRREQAEQRGNHHTFDGSILALRKFASSELLDGRFNISMVAQRQGHGPQVLAKHYANPAAPPTVEQPNTSAAS